MNIPSANEDTDFPVFKAGPPLPMRTKGKPQVKTKSIAMTPLKAQVISNQPQSQVTPRGSAKNGNIVTTTESKVKQYIERVKAKDELGRKKRLKAEQMLSLEDLYQVNLDEKSDEPQVQPELEQVQEKLRETMRIVKEKDELINKLRESCHDLAIKCADAENRVDELRFSYGRSGSGKEAHGSICGDATTTNHDNESSFHRRSASVDGLFVGCKGDGKSQSQQKESKDAHTQVEPQSSSNDAALSAQEVGNWREEDDILQETCSNWMEKVQNWKTDSNFNLSQDSGGDRDSGFRSNEVDNESIRRQQRLLSSTSPRLPGKSDNANENAVTKSNGERSLKISTRCSNCTQEVQVPPATITLPVPRRASCIAATSISAALQEKEEPESFQSQHFWPSFSSSQSHFHLSRFQNDESNSNSTKAKSMFYELAEADRNKHAYFQERAKHRHQLHGAKSLDLLYFPQTSHLRTKEELKSFIDSSFDPPEFILKSHLNSQYRSIDKKVKMLDPLLDDATQIALRVKQKSERLAKMLHDACVFD